MEGQSRSRIVEVQVKILRNSWLGDVVVESSLADMR